MLVLTSLCSGASVWHWYSREDHIQGVWCSHCWGWSHDCWYRWLPRELDHYIHQNTVRRMSRKSTSGCTTTISLHHIIQLSNELKIQRQNQAGNHSSKAVSYNTSESANLRGVLSGLLWHSRMLRPRSITVIMRRTLWSICLSVCAIPSKEHGIYCQRCAFITLIDLRSKLDFYSQFHNQKSNIMLLLSIQLAKPTIIFCS